MATIEHFKQLFSYHNWANRRVAEALGGESYPQALRLLAHVLGAQKVWLLRINGSNLTGAQVWPDLSFKECLALDAECELEWRDLFAGLDDQALKRPISYTNSKGESFTNTVEEIVTHMFNHATYHRGQIATKIREGGGTPPVTDFIAFVRE